jgi:hypothetical protein
MYHLTTTRNREPPGTGFYESQRRPRIKLIKYLAPATAAITPISAGAKTKKSDSVKLKGTTYGTHAGEEHAATI